MSMLFQPILSLALRSIIANRIQKNLDFQEFIPFPELISGDSNGLSLNLSKLPLNRVNSITNIEYVSALALKLFHMQIQSQPDPELLNIEVNSAINLAEKIQQDLHQSIQITQTIEPLDRIWQNFTITTNLSGWIYWQLSDLGLMEWLQALFVSVISTELPSQIDVDHVSKNAPLSGFDPQSKQAFLILAAHARCCSLLKTVRSGSPSYQAPQPAAHQLDLNGLSLGCPDLDWPDLDWSTQRAWYRRSSVWNLIVQISDTLDYLAMLPQPLHQSPQSFQFANQSFKVATRLGQAFQDFYADHTWSAGHAEHLDQSEQTWRELRFRLVRITQRILQIIVEQCLHLQAPVQL
jgi:hypothetical protein